MSFLRSILAVVFWCLAVGLAIPALMAVYPSVYELALALRGGESASMGSSLAGFLESSQGAIACLILSALCIANATLLNIVSAISRL